MVVLALALAWFNQDSFAAWRLQPSKVELFVLQVGEAELPLIGTGLDALPIVEHRELTPSQAKEMLAILSTPATYAVPYPPTPGPTPSLDGEVEGGVEGGMPSCLGFDLAVRFTEPHRVLECFICLHCGSLVPANPAAQAANTRLSLSESGAERLRQLFCAVLKNTDGACLSGC